MQLPEPKSLRFAASRLKSLLQTLEVVDVDSYAPLSGAVLRLYYGSIKALLRLHYGSIKPLLRLY